LCRGPRAVVHLGIPNFKIEHVSTLDRCNVGIVTTRTAFVP
jgi:hypothetical protein